MLMIELAFSKTYLEWKWTEKQLNQLHLPDIKFDSQTGVSRHSNWRLKIGQCFGAEQLFLKAALARSLRIGNVVIVQKVNKTLTL